MNMFWLCITSVLSITRVFSEQIIDTSHIRVFPATHQSIAGVFQVSYLNDLNLLEYAFNASEARRLCWSLGVTMASKAQVKEALHRGLETCRFGWVDEHFAVIPRNTPLSNCGQNKTGLVTWRAAVTQTFDVFCFNESDAAAQLKDTTTDSPLSTRDYSEQTQTPTVAANSNQNMSSTFSSSPPPSSSPTPKTMDSEAEPARFVGSGKGSSGVTAIIITSTCALILIAVIIPAYIKMRRSRVLTSDVKQPEEYIQTEECICLKNIKETKKAVPEDERIDVDGHAS